MSPKRRLNWIALFLCCNDEMGAVPAMRAPCTFASPPPGHVPATIAGWAAGGMAGMPGFNPLKSRFACKAKVLCAIGELGTVSATMLPCVASGVGAVGDVPAAMAGCPADAIQVGLVLSPPKSRLNWITFIRCYCAVDRLAPDGAGAAPPTASAIVAFASAAVTASTKRFSVTLIMAMAHLWPALKIEYIS
jgi:hypothetical protein